MKCTPVRLKITDHAIVRFLEREMGFDVAGIRTLLTQKAQPAAEMGATSLAIGTVKLVLVEMGRHGDTRDVSVTTVLPRVNDRRRTHRDGLK